MSTLSQFIDGTPLQMAMQNGLSKYVNSATLVANVATTLTVPTDENGKPARYVIFGRGQATTDNFYARCFNTNDSFDRTTNGTFAEYVTNGTFTSDTGWTKGTGWSISGGVAKIDGSQVAASTLTQTSAISLLPSYIYTTTITTTLTSHVTNGTFSSDTGWTENSGWSISAGTAVAVTASSTLTQTCPVTLVAGRTYTCTFTTTRSAGSVALSLGGGTPGASVSSANTFTQTITAGSAQDVTFTGTGFSGTLDNVTITAIGNLTMSLGGGTAGTAITTAATTIQSLTSGTSQVITVSADANFVGTVDNLTVSGWVLGTGWTTDGSTAIATGAISTTLSQTANTAYPLTSGQAYLVKFDATQSAGSIAVSLGGGSAGTSRSTSATFSEVIIAGSTQAITFTGSGFTGTIDNVTILACAAVPSNVTTGLSAEQNPQGYFLGNTTNGTASNAAATISIVSAATPIITASFYK